MELLMNGSTDPVYNLALEEYALTAMDRELVILWRNRASVIIGSNQNAVEEMDMDYIREHGITVIRRQSGGGAVFHDTGNINYTVIQAMGDGDFSNYEKFTAPVCGFLRSLGINASLQGRNDLVIDGMKFSGNAQAVKNGRIMHHGTILYDANVESLAGALKPNRLKIESRGIRSVRSRVTNVIRHMPEPIPVEEFLRQLADYFRNNGEIDSEYQLTDEDDAAIRKLVRDKYGTWEWNFGKSPPYNYQNAARFAFGVVDLRLTVQQGMMKEVHIYGDFFGVHPREELENILTGLRHNREEIAGALKGISLQKYIHGMSEEQLLSLF